MNTYRLAQLQPTLSQQTAELLTLDQSHIYHADCSAVTPVPGPSLRKLVHWTQFLNIKTKLDQWQGPTISSCAWGLRRLRALQLGRRILPTLHGARWL